MPGDSTEAARQLSLIEYWYVFKKRWILAALTFLSVLVTSVLFETNRPPVFSTSIEIMIPPEPLSEQVRSMQPAQRKRISDLHFAYYVEHAKSDACIGAVIAQGVMGAAPTPKSPAWLSLIEAIGAITDAQQVGERRIVRISTRGGDPEFIYRLANAFGPAYIESLAMDQLTSTLNLERFLDDEIRTLEVEVATYRAMVAALERRMNPPLQRDVAPPPPSPPDNTAELIEARRRLRDRAVAVEALNDSLAAGLMPSIEEMEIAITGILGAASAETIEGLGGAARDLVETARAAWVARLQKYRLLSRTLTDYHPDKITARTEAREAGTELIQRIATWARVADAQLVERIERRPASRTPLVETLAASETGPGPIVIGGETIVPNPLAIERYRVEISMKEGLLSDHIRKRANLRIERSTQREPAEWIRPAMRPGAPDRANIKRGLTFGATIGLFVAFAAVMIVESLDPSIKAAASSGFVLGKKVIGVVPCFTDPESASVDPTPARLVIRRQPSSPEAEAYRSLAHKLDVMPQRLIVVTSTGPQEGKSTTCANLSGALAEMGRKVLLVSANLRRPTLHRIFALNEAPGLTDIVRDGRKIADCIQETEIPGLHFLGSGFRPEGHVAEFVTSPILVENLRAMLAEYDFVLVDVPPAAPVSDALSFARSADGVLLVYMLGRASVSAVASVIRSLEDVDAQIIGVVTNDARGVGLAYGYNYAERYYRYEDDRKGP
jgi:capsular exopolysaccharide synthesis family protein